MLTFLKEARRLFAASESLCIVIGNESCDLDSAVSALCLAYFYHENKLKSLTTTAKNFIPILNIPRKDYQLKTEVNFLFNKYQIQVENLTFRDDMQDELIKRSEFILVDHHVSPFATHCAEVFDHRPLDETAKLPETCKTNIQLVGSCATLIGELFLKNISTENDINKYYLPLELLRNTIILDTVNFSSAAGRATTKDSTVCEAIEKILHKTDYNMSRSDIFDMLRTARADISHLTASQLLRKDLKIITNSNESLKIAMPGFPLQVQDFILKPQAAESLREFAMENNCAIVLLIGMFVREDDGTVKRDIGIININSPKLCAKIENELLNSKDPSLDLQHVNSCCFLGGQFYLQNNIKATRKHIIPIVKNALENFQILDQQVC
ncbi:exopolyphosphatase PRUNE1 [Teleopsis dalmanni]|uniref:exopolyphosphatase PRUNE1 n=1 Tax=Teleopsis dalmanni TaxID=139649 RepID=UPI0018CFE75B|nr:exopolyphosphatase PRUNE1 [Teleopsis dalmanni]